MFFSMLIKEEFEEGVNTVQDLIDRDMELGKYTTYTESGFLVAKATQAFTAIYNSVSHTFSVPPISQSK